MQRNYDFIRKQAIGNVEFVAPNEIKVILNTDAPQGTSLNTGVPQFFPRVNGFLLFPNEIGAIIGMIYWIGIEYSPYPKRKGYKDFDLVDLPYPLRKLSVKPLGVLKEENSKFVVKRGVFSYPSVGDIVLIPNQNQLKAIVENKREGARIKIGTAPNAANAPVYVDPDKIFGRHLAILGNTGSGKSCSVAGLIRWSIKEAKKNLIKDKKLNARFIVLDPNGEYSNAFDGICDVRKYQVIHDDVRPEDDATETPAQPLRVPSWMWNSYEWGSIGLATERTQRPLLRQALREVRVGSSGKEDYKSRSRRRFLSSFLISLRNYYNEGIKIGEWPGKDNLGGTLTCAKGSLEQILAEMTSNDKKLLVDLHEKINNLLIAKKIKDGKYKPYNLRDITPIIGSIECYLETYGGVKNFIGPDEDCPVYFSNKEFLAHLEMLASAKNVQQYMDYFLMRLESILSNPRIASVIDIESKEKVTLGKWLEDYIGCDKDNGSIIIIDLSLLPSEIIYVITSVLSRIIFEAHQRYKREKGDILPTVLVVEEAHNFVKRYEGDSDEINAARLCSKSFEKIAKEGRKFGLGLVISSQRPSELSQTVLSQCNTFLLHRIVNDRDQEMVKRLVPDNLGGMLIELPILPTRKAILLGWAAPIPLIVEINNLPQEYRPESKDPDFWDVWIGKKERTINWKEICDEWQKLE